MVNSYEGTLLAAGVQSPAAGVLAKSTFVLYRSAIPVILAPNGTIATNGTVTLGTALPLVYASAWVRFPAGAVVGGLAGLYFVKFSSTTVGQVYTNYNNATVGFVPSIPDTQVVAVGSNSAYTQTTGAEVTLANVTLAGNSMGPDGSVLVALLEANNNSAGAKIVRAKFGGTAFISQSVTTSLAMETEKRVTNRGVVNAQLLHADGAFGVTSAVAPTQLAVDTSADVAILVTGQIAVATDYLVVEQFLTELRPS